MDQHIRRMSENATLLLRAALLRRKIQYCEVQQEKMLRGPHVRAPHNGRVLPVRSWDRDSLPTICTSASIISTVLKRIVSKQVAVL